MRKYLLPFAIAVLLVLTACGINSGTSTPQPEPPPTIEATDNQEPEQETSNESPLAEEEPTSASNPFAAPLLEYFADGYDGFNGIINDSTRAFWADITGSGERGVLAIRFVSDGEVTYIRETPQPIQPFAQARIFYLVGEQVIYYDIDDFRTVEFSDELLVGTMPLITPTGRLVIDTRRDMGDLALTLLEVDFSWAAPVLVYSRTIYRDWSQGGDTFYSFPGGFGEGMSGGRTPITQEEFDAVLADIGWDDAWVGWALREDETEQILLHRREQPS
ncbi:MAG: hypothetical protein FWE19_09310 [Oscillospiraceae bacterium]|nr:hypothetical protein [Oscillospiraceae bacterium]